MNRREQKYVEILRKRERHLLVRIERRERAGENASFDRAEVAAIRWALSRAECAHA